MKGFFKRLHQDSRGFTLIELLVVVAILGVLAAIVLPNFTGLVDWGEQESGEAELAVVQTAMDTMMTVNSLGTVTATNSTQDMSAFPTGNPLYPDHLRYQYTTGNYSCVASGLVTQEDSGY